MQKNYRKLLSVFLPFASAVVGAACTKWLPYDWFFNVLGYSVLLGLVLAFLAGLDAKNERRPHISIALVLSVLWLPTRDADVNFGPLLWMFFCVAAFVIGILTAALLLPFFA